MARVLLAFEPPDGGVAENVAQLALGLGAHGYAVEVAGPARSPAYPGLEAAGVLVHRTAWSRSYRRPDASCALCASSRCSYGAGASTSCTATRPRPACSGASRRGLSAFPGLGDVPGEVPNGLR
ncbi:MAG TPA: hypothetical protein VHR88_07275 [Solirubrobacteraceae bacterium]|nr:hypothetical protein [Solirubrobacteraceae bacterium]